MKMTQTILVLALAGVSVYGAETSAPEEKSFEVPHGMKVSVKMIGPYAQPADLQIICAFKHKAEGDTYLGAMKDLDTKLGGLLSSLRNRGVLLFCVMLMFLSLVMEIGYLKSERTKPSSDFQLELQLPELIVTSTF